MKSIIFTLWKNSMTLSEMSIFHFGGKSVKIMANCDITVAENILLIVAIS